MITDHIQPGISTEKIDKLCYEFIKDNKGYSAPLFYRGFKKSLCTSLNHVVCHGIPSEERISVARLLSGFSSSSKVGSLPNTPQEANRNTRAKAPNPPRNRIQNPLMYVLKSDLVSFLETFFFGVAMCLFFYALYSQAYISDA